ncbi:MAG: alpha/beta hydrolase [Bacteroidales bacterium]|jgi:esterase/lipase|nr:hypothetical protein [Bacteroidales bacterium]MCK9499132.1 hypothetical protein [Bacteroidales bacterium]MDY0315594.1 hypothetical protein [Bacteroidales bacterium]NLB85816.1 alpha/beta hydrolase [Bacteroidales bacterium]
MKNRLIILSDIYGLKNSAWLEDYSNYLNQYFQIKLYDILKLAEIGENISNLKKVHYLFVKNGIDKAVSNLISLETQEIYVLGFSLGGTIAWISGLNGLKIKSLFAVSSTRLRYETEKPKTNIKLIYGEKDEYIPNKNWFLNMDLSAEFVLNQRHEFYKEKKFIKQICDTLLD